MFYSSLTDASRLQFAVTAMYHWLFVPLTLGLGFIVAFMETRYYLLCKKAAKNPADSLSIQNNADFWLKTTKFWSTIFAINFAIGVATGIILEFEFGTNWSNYSWFVGDIFGAPLAIEGVIAFFMESTFFAVMYFGWNKVSKRFHLVSTWLTAIGANISAIWILVANSWMQHPVGMHFNPDTARNEMVDFAAVVFSPTAISKISHTISSSFMLAAVVVIAISCWYLLKGREMEFAKKSIKLSAIFGLCSALFMAWSGDNSAYNVAKTQPMKLAAMEGLYNGEKDAAISIFGILKPGYEQGSDENPFYFNIKVPKILGYMANRKAGAFTPGINDIIEGGYQFEDIDGNEYTAKSFKERQLNGKVAIKSLELYHFAKQQGDTSKLAELRNILQDNFKDFGYGYLKTPKESIPNVPLCYYSFRVMVGLGCYFILFFIASLLLLRVEKRGGKPLEKRKFLLRIALLSLPLIYICSQAGWVVAEVGRQPWTIQDLLPVQASVSGIKASSVYTTVIIFITLFTALLAAEIKIMCTQIKKGPHVNEE